MGNVTLSCPSCKRKFTVTRPDSLHPSWSLEKPQESEAGDVVEQVYGCKNPGCNAKFTVYWFETMMFLDRA
ncbi:MAG: hypothetical protein ACE14S_01250 [Candidatus Bathyarchaeia archaeon]